MTDKQIISLIEKSLEEKNILNTDFIKYSFYEINVKYNLNNTDKNTFLKFLRIKLENNNYNVFAEGQTYEYKNIKNKVLDNEVLIAIKK